MATVNSVPNAICNIPLTGIAPPRVLMCSASMGAEGSVTLQLREAVQAPDSNNSLDTALTIGYPDPEMLADVLGTLQAAALNNNNNSSSLVTSNNNPSCTTTVNGKLQNNISTRINNSSSSGGNSNSSSSNSNNNINNINNNNNNTICNQINNNINCSSSGNSNSSTTSSSSNVSENSGNSVTVSQNPIIVVRKPRPKTSSPTRHGPQQCQVCSKVFGNASALAKHKLTHSDERKYVCAMCSKAFKRQDHLNGHMLTHRNKKPYECKAEGCGKSYCDARSLRRHTENHHSTLAMTATTPSNQSLSPSTGPPTGLSLSPATASGDASSPHGATCVQYISNCGDGGNNSKPSSPSSPAGSGNEGLTRQQLDLISQIMQQTKQASAQVTVSTNHNGLKHQQQQQNQQQLLQQQQQSQRPRTWNMQTQLQQTQTKSPNSLENFTTLNGATITSGGITINGANITSSGAITSTTLSNQQQNQQQTHQNQTVIQQNQIGQTINIVKIEQKPVECNLCHRKFKNVPALNGHMRLHGGYFKKENETKKCEKKESIGPPLQTASIGVRALIEEKIISKRTKDLKGAFVVPAPPLTTTRRISDIENFLTPKTPGTPSSLQTITLQQQNQSNLSSSSSTGTVSTTTTNNNNNNNGQLSTTIGSTTLQLNQKQTIQKITNISTISQGTSTDSKDATLIELLKRGTKVAVKRTCSDTGQLFSTTGTVILPSDHHQSLSSPNTPNPTPPLSISLQNGETTPLALTISQAPNGTGDVYTLTYSTDSTSTYFGDNDVYSVSDTAMLLQAVDSMQLLNDSATNQLVDDTATINDYTLKDNNNSTQITKSNLTNNNNINNINNNNNNNNNDGRQEFTPTSKQLQDVLNSPLPDSLAEFGTFHSKDFILYNCGGNNTQNTITSSPSQSTSISIQSSSVSPLPSPLAYPTPPASHEAVTESSPFLDDSHHFPDASAFFDDKTTVNFIHDNNDHHQFFKDTTTVINDDCNLTENEKILKLKNELFNDSKSVFVNNEHHEFFKCNDNSSDVFDNQVKVEDLLNENSGEECDLKDFNDQNLSFLDEPQNFLDDSRNPSSPLSESFFTSGIGTAEEVKEVLKDVLPNENLTCDNQCENDIDLYYLPGLTLQSQMMPNSDDPLLSSSPKDFGHNRILLQQQQNQQQQQQQQQLQIQKFDPVQFFSNNNNNTTNIKRPRTNDNIFINNSNINGLTAGSNTAIHTNINGALTMTVQSLHHQQQHQIQEQQYIQQQQQQQQKDNNNTTVDSFINPTLPTIINISSTNGCHQSRINNFIQNDTIPISTPPPPQPISIQQCSSSVTSFVSVTSHHTTPTSTTQITSSILKRRLRQGSTNNNNFIPKKHEIYRSKLRKPSTTHYTPAPLLNPDRKASGLYTNLPKSLLQDTISFGDEFDDTASLVAFLDDSKVNIGTAYQATIPSFLINNNIDNINNDSTIINNNNNNNYDDNDDDELMWDPKMISKSLNDDEKSLIRFIELSKSSAVPLGFHSEEVALKALLQAQGDTHIAVLNLLQSPSNSVHLKWTGTEVEIFLKGLEKYGKDFYRISAEITTKTTSDCIQLYYFWKKLCIDYKTTHLKQDSYDTNDNHNNHHNQNNTSHSEPRPHVCEMPDCSASFTSKAALHGHIRIHCIGRNNIVNGMSISSANGNCNGNGNGGTSTTGNTTIQNGITNTSNSNIFTFPVNNNTNNTTVQNSNNKDDFPCKVCGKVFNKVKSRSAHMKSHRPQDNDQSVQNNNNNNINNLNNNQQTIILTSN